MAIDISKPQGQALIRRLAEKADVVLENFKFGGLAKLGLGPEDLLTLNPRLVYCSITGFGQTGPYRNRAGYDFLMQGMGGLMSVTGAPEGEPMKAGVAVVDVFTGLYASNAVMAALLERERSGLGQHIDLALFDVQIAAMANQISSYLVSGAQPPRLGNAHPSIVPYQVFPTLDGHLILAIGNDEQFARFVTLAGAPELSQDERFATNPARVKHRAILVPLLEALLAARTTKDWTEALEAFGIPGGPINEFADIDADPQVQARGIFKTLGRACAVSRARCASRGQRSRMTAHRRIWALTQTKSWPRCWRFPKQSAPLCATIRSSHKEKARLSNRPGFGLTSLDQHRPSPIFDPEPLVFSCSVRRAFAEGEACRGHAPFTEQGKYADDPKSKHAGGLALRA
ncbi:CaiB/BaiF CoA transferase family protein [Acidocella sp. MX-AZ03]|uniref:CaiB/BaiF CoA transferase family protein n=1 Tax=Acidocella sp. MX-AZ03 TaxID=2697363 RepID=UPI003FA46AA4